MAITVHGRTRTSLADINITPLVDVVLVLLVIFMITAPILQSGIEVDLPQTRTVKAITQEKVVITIDKSDNIYLGDNPINIHVLGETALDRLKGDASAPVYIRCDRIVPFGTFATVIDTLKQAGLKNISVVTQPLSTKGG